MNENKLKYVTIYKKTKIINILKKLIKLIYENLTIKKKVILLVIQTNIIVKIKYIGQQKFNGINIAKKIKKQS